MTYKKRAPRKSATEQAYEIVTEKIIEKLEAGTVPWRKPWGSANKPRNLTTGDAYRGINTFLLNMAGYESPYFLTFIQLHHQDRPWNKEKAKEVKAKGRDWSKWDSVGTVPPGTKGLPIVRLIGGENEEENSKGEIVKKSWFSLKHYHVFNVAQCTGIEDFVPKTDKAPKVTAETDKAGIAASARIIKDMKDAPKFHNNPDRAFYHPELDYISMPPVGSFEDGELGWFPVAFHELVHSTGHHSRLNRFSKKDAIRFGDADYSKEELIAEMGSAYLSGEASLSGSDPRLDNSVAYIAGWIKSCRKDPGLLVSAAGKAQRAADYILGTAKG
jgi:antirestriction protein ArdC